MPEYGFFLWHGNTDVKENKLWYILRIEKYHVITDSHHKIYRHLQNDFEIIHMKISFHGNLLCQMGHIAKILCENITFSCEWCITSLCIVNFKQLCENDLAFLLFTVGVHLSSGTPAKFWRLGFFLVISIRWRRACFRKNRKIQQKTTGIIGHIEKYIFAIILLLICYAKL